MEINWVKALFINNCTTSLLKEHVNNGFIKTHDDFIQKLW